MLRLNQRQNSVGKQWATPALSLQRRINRESSLTNIPHMRGNQDLVVDMKGDGIFDMIKGAYDKAKQAGSFLSDAYSSQTAKDLINLLPDSDDTARPGFAGEKHAILKLKNGRPGVANYMGPNTNLIEKLKRNDPGRTPIDTVAKAHDMRYHNANNIEDLEKPIEKCFKK